MTRLTFPGATYCGALPDGGRFVEYHNRIDIGGQSIPWPPGGGALALVGRRINGQLYLAAQGHDDGQAWLWSVSGWRAVAPTHGVRPCAFGSDSLFVAINPSTYLRLNLLTGESTTHPLAIGSQGLRYANGSTPVAGDATLFDGIVHEFIDRGDVRGGQGHLDGYLLNGRVLETGNCQFGNLERDGAQLAVGIVKFLEGQAVLHWLNVSEIGLLPSASVHVEPPPDPEPDPVPTYRSEHDILPYLKQRWSELGIPAQVKLICDEFGIHTNKEMTRIRLSGNPEEKARKEKAFNAIRAIQVPALFLSVSELHHVKGFKDVGLGRKTSGANWENKATDIIVLKPLNGVGQVLQADALSGSGYPEAKPMWDEIAFNPERTWVEPPAVAGQPDPEPEPDPVPEPEPDPDPTTPVSLEDLWRVFVTLRDADQQRVDHLEKRVRALEQPRKVALRTENGSYICAENGGSGEVNATRTSAGAWETFTEEPQ